MGFAWEVANAGNFGGADVWERPAPSPRHRKPPRGHHVEVTELGRGALTAAAAAGRWARTIIVTRPALADHRRAF